MFLREFYTRLLKEFGSDEPELPAQVLCLTVLIAAEKLPPDATLFDANTYFDKIGDCNYCPFRDRCMAVRLEQ